MANSLFNQLNKNNLSNNNGLVNLLKNSNNPQQMIMNMAKQNPQIANVLNLVNANGGNAKDLFYKKAQEMGVDPNTILNQLK